MSGRLLTSDPVSKTERRFYSNHDATDLVVATRFDYTDIAELNKARYALQERHTRHGEFNQYASVPMPIMMGWEAEWREKELSPAEIERDLARKLDDRDNLLWRTRPGRIGDMIASRR